MKKNQIVSGRAQQCYDLLSQVPRGLVTTYKALAHAMGIKSARAVWQRMRRNPHIPHVPCHRVVQVTGWLGWYAHGIDKKIALLKSEWVQVKNGKIADFEKVFWDGFSA